MAKLSEKARRFLTEPRFAVAATMNKDGTPQQTVVWYELDDDRILMNTRVGRQKERNLKRDPRLSICVADGYHYVTIRGIAELVYDRKRAHEGIKALAIRYHGPEKGQRQYEEVYSSQERVTIYLSIDRVEEYGL